MKRCLLLSVLLAMFAAATPAFALGFIIVVDASLWPGPNPPPPPPYPIPPWPHPIRPRPHPCTPLEVSYVKVNTRIKDQVAVTAVDQEFYNPNSMRLEGTFVFPIPKGAHIDKFSMEIDGRQVEAELLKAEKARGIYEDIVRKMRDPALLEYAGRDVFKVRIFPIEPNSRKRVTISYTQLLKADDGLVSYSLPLNTEKFSAKPIRNVSGPGDHAPAQIHLFAQPRRRGEARWLESRHRGLRGKRGPARRGFHALLRAGEG
jgi:hypothetical protein